MEIPKAYNWVKARSACSVDQLFLLLAQTIKADVEAANALTPNHQNFKYATPTTDRIVVVRPVNGGQYTAGAIVFRRTVTAIEAIDMPKDPSTEQVMFSGIPSLDVGGECRLEVEGEPLELWQFSRRALEPFFFA
jgi:hypothetical protein